MHSIIKKIAAIILSAVIAFTSFGAITASAVNSAETDNGTFRCDWFDESIVYPYTYSDEWFSQSSYEYNHSLATLSLDFAMASFESFDTENPDENIRDMLTQCGFEVTSYGYDTEGYDTVGVAFGQKNIKLDGNEYTLIAAPIRSGNYGMEWGGNLRVGKGINHKGFDMAKELVIQYLNEYLATADIEHEIKLLIPGYSRGASISDLTVASLDDGSYKSALNGDTDYIAQSNIKKENLYSYTFEAPQCTKNENAHDEIYSNIFNIINPNDYVPKFIMDSWGFTHFGNQYYLPCADNCADYDSYYSKVCKEFDTMMADTGKKSSAYFYTKEDSISAEAIVDYIFDGLSKKVMISQEYFADTYEDDIVYLAGQYISQKKGADEIAYTAGIVFVATVLCATPKNMEKVRNNGYLEYLAANISESNIGDGRTDSQIKASMDLLGYTLEYFNNNTYNIFALMGQLKTLLYVHQPYIALTWMRVLNADDMRQKNSDKDKIGVNCDSLNLKYNTNALVRAEYDSSGGNKVVWTSDNPTVASVSDEGVVRAGIKGTATITAKLVGPDGSVISTAQTKVSVHMNVLQFIFYSIQNLVK